MKPHGLSAWLPIETAPKDGTWILLAGGFCLGDVGDNNCRIVSAQWTEYINGRIDPEDGHWQFAWYEGGYCGVYENPTHWMTLPLNP